ncbi:MAG: hypothetical protein ACTSYA_12100 [Candidatus Kariarchaeaceae archaeon]
MGVAYASGNRKVEIEFKRIPKTKEPIIREILNKEAPDLKIK